MPPQATKFTVDFEIGDKILGTAWWIPTSQMEQGDEAQKYYYRRATKAIQEAVRHPPGEK